MALFPLVTVGIVSAALDADVAYVRSSENQSAGASLGGQLRRYCDGARVRYLFIA